MRYVFDLDGTLCNNTDGKYHSALPKLERISKVNSLYLQGHHITILTARGMSTHENDAAKARDQWYDLTKSQLEEWGVKYHDLFLGKPAGDFYIDDRGVKDVDFFLQAE